MANITRTAAKVAVGYPDKAELDNGIAAAAIEAAEEKVDALRERLNGLDIDALSPREALDLLYELKAQANG